MDQVGKRRLNQEKAFQAVTVFLPVGNFSQLKSGMEPALSFCCDMAAWDTLSWVGAMQSWRVSKLVSQLVFTCDEKEDG